MIFETLFYKIQFEYDDGDRSIRLIFTALKSIDHENKIRWKAEPGNKIYLFSKLNRML